MHCRRLATAIMLATATTLAPLFAAAQSAEIPTRLTVVRVRHIQPIGAAGVDLTWWWFKEQGPDAVGFTIQWAATDTSVGPECEGSFPSTNDHYEAGGNRRAAAIQPLNREKTYCFRIRTDAADANYDSGWSPAVGPFDLEEEMDLGSHPEPSITGAVAGHSQVTLGVTGASCPMVADTQWEYAWRDVVDNWEDIPSRSGRLSTLDGRAGGTQTVTVNMTNGRNYIFRVRYHCSETPAVYSSWSFESEIVTPTTRFPAPTGLRAVGGNSSCRLSWNRPATPPRSYDIERRGYPAPEDGTHNWVASGSPTGSAASHTVQGLSDGTQYQFQIRAVAENGESDWSESAVCETLGGSANDPPEALGTLGPFTLPVGTTMPIEVSDYFRDPDGDDLEYSARSSNRTFVAVSGSGSSFTLTGAAIGSAQISVTATDPAGESAEQTAEVTVVETPTPGPPTNVTLTANDTTLTLSWDEPANTRDFGSIAYEVQFRRDGGPWSTTGVTINGTSATLTGVRGSSYRARVLAKSGDARSPWAQAGPETVPETPTPGPPTNVTLTANDTTLTLSWDEPANTRDFGSIAYEVQFRRDGGPWSTTGVTIDGTSATLTGVRGSSYRARRTREIRRREEPLGESRARDGPRGSYARTANERNADSERHDADALLGRAGEHPRLRQHRLRGAIPARWRAVVDDRRHHRRHERDAHGRPRQLLPRPRTREIRRREEPLGASRARDGPRGSYARTADERNADGERHDADALLERAGEHPRLRQHRLRGAIPARWRAVVDDRRHHRRHERDAHGRPRQLLPRPRTREIRRREEPLDASRARDGPRGAHSRAADRRGGLP